MQKHITDDLEALLEALPPHISQPLLQREDRHDLLEVVMDLGRPAEARYPQQELPLGPREVTAADLEYVVSRIGAFGDDNRAGIERTLHRISAIRNRKGRVVGLSCRVGRAVFGTIRIIQDLVESGKSILLLGRPGVGKTTMLREVARVLADDLKKRVIIVDTSNEIAGDGDIPHPAIGRARRMQVTTPAMQHAVMIEAVENHMPEVIVIDEIGTELEAMAARTIAERGVQLVATAHGNILDNLMMNPTLSDLIGGIQTVTLGDEEARRRGTQKSILERKAPPTFEVVVEIKDRDRLVIHSNVAEAVDGLLRGSLVATEVRWLDEAGELRVEMAPPSPSVAGSIGSSRLAGELTSVTVYPFGVDKARLEQAARGTPLALRIAGNLEEADVLVTLRGYYRRKLPKLKEAEASGVPIYVLRGNSMSQIEHCLTSIYEAKGGRDSVRAAVKEAEEAAARVCSGVASVELSPQNAYIRRLQHQLVQRYALTSQSRGREPYRRVRMSRRD